MSVAPNISPEDLKQINEVRERVKDIVSYYVAPHPKFRSVHTTTRTSTFCAGLKGITITSNRSSRNFVTISNSEMANGSWTRSPMANETMRYIVIGEYVENLYRYVETYIALHFWALQRFFVPSKE